MIAEECGARFFNIDGDDRIDRDNCIICTAQLESELRSFSASRSNHHLNLNRQSQSSIVNRKSSIESRIVALNEMGCDQGPIILVKALIKVLQENSHPLQQSGQPVRTDSSRMRLTHVWKSSNEQAPLGDRQFSDILDEGTEATIGEKVLLDVGGVERRNGLPMFPEVFPNRRERLRSSEIPDYGDYPVVAVKPPQELIVILAGQEIAQFSVQVLLHDQILQSRKVSPLRASPIPRPGAVLDIQILVSEGAVDERQ